MEPVSARMRVLAGRVAGAADTAHDVGTRFAAVDGVDWQGATATEFRTRARSLVAATAALTTACDEAAGRLAVHAEALAGLERSAAALLRAAA